MTLFQRAAQVYIYATKRSHTEQGFPARVDFAMADVETTMPTLDDKHSSSDDASVEKKALDGAEVTEDAIMAKEVEEFEERLQRDEATDEEYLVQEAYEVAIKVRPSTHTLHTLSHSIHAAW